MVGAIEGAGPVAAAAVAEARESREAIREAARGLEAALLREMLTAMERAQLEDGLFGKGPGSGAIQSTFELLLTEALGETEPFGVADRIADQLARAAGAPAADSAGDPRQAGDSAERLLREALDLAREGGISFGEVPIYSDEGSSPGPGDR
jgi:Rod binding domain-containing protein